MKKLFKKNSFGESIEAYVARAYCSCYCSSCNCSLCMPGDQAHDESVFQVTGQNQNSTDGAQFKINNPQ